MSGNGKKTKGSGRMPSPTKIITQKTSPHPKLSPTVKPETKSITSEPPTISTPKDNSIWRNFEKKEVVAIVAGLATVVGLVAAFIIAGFQIAGVIDMGLAHWLIFSAGVVVAIGIGVLLFAWERLNSVSKTLKAIILIISIIISGVCLLLIDTWMVSKKAEIDRKAEQERLITQQRPIIKNETESNQNSLQSTNTTAIPPSSVVANVTPNTLASVTPSVKPITPTQTENQVDKLQSNAELKKEVTKFIKSLYEFNQRMEKRKPPDLTAERNFKYSNAKTEEERRIILQDYTERETLGRNVWSAYRENEYNSRYYTKAKTLRDEMLKIIPPENTGERLTGLYEGLAGPNPIRSIASDLEELRDLLPN